MKYILPIFLLGASFAYAQDYSSVSGAGDSVNNDGGLEAVITAQESTPPVAGPDAYDQIDAWLKDKGWKQGWDVKNKRIITLIETGAKIRKSNPSQMIVKREMLFAEAELSAKALIIQTFLTEASAKTVLSIPGNPIAEQVEAQQKQYDASIAEASERLKYAKADLEAQTQAYDKALLDDLEGVTINDRGAALLDGLIKKLDEQYDSAALSEAEAERVDFLKDDLDSARIACMEAVEWEKKLIEAADKAKGEKKKSVGSSVEFQSDMTLFGAVTLAQAESYDARRGNYKMCIAVAWSPKLEEEARKIWLGKMDLKPRENKKSLQEYVDGLELENAIGTRRYLASDGTTNFLGISAVEYDPDDPSSLNQKRMEANIWAKQRSLMSLISDVAVKEEADRLMDSVEVDGEVTEIAYDTFAANLSAEVQNMQVRGLEIVTNKKVIHPISGQHILVSVANVNSALAAQSADILAKTNAVLTEVNYDQSYKKGQIEGMKAVAESAKDSPAARQLGREHGANQVSEEVVKNRKSFSKEASSAQIQNTSEAVKARPSGSMTSGSYLSADDVDDDF
jgi:hypothetical protein